ncbi:MAG: hypothetical protein V1928_03165 [Parcubacteria group bacterium]
MKRFEFEIKTWTNDIADLKNDLDFAKLLAQSDVRRARNLIDKINSAIFRLEIDVAKAHIEFKRNYVVA